MVGLEPNLLWDIGFQLSFFAMAGLLVATSYYPRGWQGALAATAGASLATLPIIAINFHHIPLVALPATLMTLPALGPIIATSALTAAIGSIFPPLAFIVSWTAWLSLSYLINVVGLWSVLPLSSLDVGSIPELWAWAYYGILLGGLAILHRRRSRGLFRPTSTGVPATGASLLTRVTTPALALPLGGAALLILGLALSPQPPLLKVRFLDVGQGDSILVEVKGQQRILIDGGPSPQAVTGALDGLFPMWDRHLDMVILTHPEADHLTGLIEVIRRYPVSRVVESGFPGSSPVYEEWQIRLEEKGLTPMEVRRGERIVLGDGVYMDVLHPGQFLEGTESDSNNNSLVIRLVAGEIAFLLSADIQKEGESAIMRAGLPLASTVLKVPHHGSATSLSASFFERVNPRLAVISLGRENPFGHPHPQTMNRLRSTTVLRTDENGTIELTTDGYNLQVTTERAISFAPVVP
jgi:competence protein ComEC